MTFFDKGSPSAETVADDQLPGDVAGLVASPGVFIAVETEHGRSWRAATDDEIRELQAWREARELERGAPSWERDAPSWPHENLDVDEDEDER